MDIKVKEGFESDVEEIMALIGHVKDLLDVWGRKDYRQHLYPLNAFENKDWKELIGLLEECCRRTLAVDTRNRKGFPHSRLREREGPGAPE